jgi:DNA-binding LacI/PurR family transcriptional regulator
VEIDNFQGAFDATTHLLELGHRRIATITGLPNSKLNEARIAGYRHALACYGAPLQPALLCFGDYSTDSGVHHGHALLALPDSPSAIFAFNDLMAMGVMQAAHARGLRVPVDLAVIGFDGLPLTAHTSPPLSTIEQPVPEMSAAAVAMLLDRIKGRETGEARMRTFTARLVARASTVGYGSKAP